MAFLTGAVRRDQSSKFSPSQTNQVYPKVSASLVLSDLDTWKNAAFTNTFNSLKLRASYGEAGNLAGILSYDRFYRFQPSTTPFLGRSTFLPSSQLANLNVRPERNNELEGGVDLGFLNDRIGFTATVYYQRIKDLVVPRTLAPTSGGSLIVDNVGEMENRGVELQLTGTPIKKEDFTWDVSFIYNRNRNKVTKLPRVNGNAQAIPIENAAGAPVFLVEGQPAGVFFGTAYARNPDGSFLLTPQGFRQDERAASQASGSVDYVPDRTGGDGQPNTSRPLANVIIGDPNPDWTGSFSSNLTYKKLGLRVLLDAVQGVSVFNADKRTRQGVGLGDLAEQELRGELPRGYIFSVYNTQEFRVDDGSFVKLREIALSYGLPTLTTFINSLNLSLIGRNLYSWDNYNGFDPETSAGGASDLLRAIDFGNVPVPRTYQVKLTATF